MKRAWILLPLLLLLALPVRAETFTAPAAPESAQSLMPEQTENFGSALLEMVRSALLAAQPALAEASVTAVALIAVMLLTALLRTMPHGELPAVELGSAVAAGMLLLRPANTLIRLGAGTVQEMSEYGKLLVPVMTSALAAQGGATASAALYAGTAFFDALLSTAIAKLIVPMLYIFLCLSVANGALGEEMFARLRDMMKSCVTWGLKGVLYLFTGYMSITGVVSGSVDKSALKAAKLTISGVVPVVGGMLSDASETVLAGAAIVKNAAGIYGMVAVLAICLGPFLRIAVQYLLLKLTAAVCAVFGSKRAVDVIQDFCTAMGMLLAMTATVCVMLLLSTVCFMKGAG